MSWWNNEMTWLMKALWLSPLLWLLALPWPWVLLLWAPCAAWLLLSVLWRLGVANQDSEQWLGFVWAALPAVLWLVVLDWQGHYWPLAHALLAGLIMPRWWLVKWLRAPRVRKGASVPLADGWYCLRSGLPWLDARLAKAAPVRHYFERRQLQESDLAALCQALGLRPRQWWPMLVRINSGRVVDISLPSWLYAPTKSI